MNVYEKLTLSTKEESEESDLSRVEPAISASVKGNILEIKKKTAGKMWGNQ